MRKLLFFTMLLASCHGIMQPSLKTVGDTLIQINPADYRCDNIHVHTNLPGGAGFSYFKGGLVQILTTNDSLAGLIKLELYWRKILFTDDQTHLIYATTHDIRYDTYFLPRYWQSKQSDIIYPDAVPNITIELDTTIIYDTAEFLHDGDVQISSDSGAFRGEDEYFKCKRKQDYGRDH